MSPSKPSRPALQHSSRSRQRRDRLAKIGFSLPESTVDEVGHGHLAFKVRKKTFAYYLFDHHGDGRIALNCKAGPGEQARLVEESPARYFVPAYVGASGWVGLRLDGARVNWGEVMYLLRSAYRLTAPARLAARLD